MEGVPPPLDDPEQLPFLAELDEDGWTEVLESTDRVAFRAGDVIVRAGDMARELFLLTEGRLVGVLHDERAGVDREVRVIEAPSVVGEVAFLDGHGRLLTMRAQTDGEVRRLSWDGFKALSVRRPELTQEIALDLGRIVAGRLRGATELIRQALSGRAG
jgi:CRP-like cAMP-binding protein